MVIWIASGNRANWEIVKKHNIWGVPKRSRGIHSRVNLGDTILIFARSERQESEILPSVILGECVVTDLFEDSTPIFITPPQMGDEVFPFRLKLNQVKQFQPPIEIKPLIPYLGFVTNKKMWAPHFRTPMRIIPEEDYQRIIEVQK